MAEGPKKTDTLQAAGTQPEPEAGQETPAQETPEVPEVVLSPTEQERADMRDASGGYKELLDLAEKLLAAFGDWQRIDADLLQQLQQNIYEYAMRVRGTLLFENLQLARYERRYYRYHLVNVALLNVMIGRSMNTSADWLAQLIRIGLLCDVGMLLLPSYIIDGRKEITDADRELIRSHPADTVDLLRESGIDDAVVLDAVLHHHERYSGGGYPDGLSGDAISLETRITSAADSFDAALARRAYRELKSPFDVLAEFAENRGGALDPAVTAKTVKLISRMLVGRHVILSDHTVAKVDYVSPSNLAYPGVKVLGRRIQTDEQLYPVSLTSHMPLK